MTTRHHAGYGLVLALFASAAVLAVAPRAAAQISGASTAGSTCTNPQGNNADGYSGCGVATQTDNGTTLATRYEFNVNADIGIFSTRDEASAATHQVAFNATAPGGYRLDIATQRTGDLNRNSDALGCEGQADITSVSGSSNVSLSSGSLNLGDPGSIGNGTSTTSIAYNQTGAATIFNVSNGAAQAHTLTFTWSASVRSNSCEAAVRVGNQNGTTTNCSACGYPGSPNRTQSSDGHFVTVTFTSLCGNSVVDGGVGEDCDEGGANGSSTSCCTSTCQFRAAGQTCRPSQGVCDPAETCGGGSGTCPGDAKSTAICRPSLGVCDADDFCNGVSNDCPPDGKIVGVCRPSAGVCDPAENCNGINNDCPTDLKSTALCRPSGGVCDIADFCDGVGDACPPDAKSTAQCRPSAGVCDIADFCDGASNTCPPDAKSTAECRPSADDCDSSESCDGAGDTCPADQSEPDGTSCDDGDPCTSADECTGGVCDGADITACVDGDGCCAPGCAAYQDDDCVGAIPALPSGGWMILAGLLALTLSWLLRRRAGVR
jgi:hypothetical protein